MQADAWIEAGLPGPVRALTTTRAGGVSRGAFANLNLGLKGGDEAERVAENRRRLSRMLPAEPLWLNQVHGNRVISLDDWHPGIQADGAWTSRPGQVAAVLSADCLPVVLADSGGRCVAVVHAGWRGMAAGVLEAGVDALPVGAGDLRAWIGPGISQPAYEVGPELRGAFVDRDKELAAYFISGRGDRFHADLKGLGRQLLVAAGVSRIFDSGLCTASDSERFFSYRRDGITGHMATVAWIAQS